MTRHPLFDRSYRNQLGRQVNSMERKLGLSFTTPTTMTEAGICDHKDHIAPQVEYLTARLRDLVAQSDSRYRWGQFSLWENDSFRGLTLGDTWNGWAEPVLPKAEADRFIASLAASFDEQNAMNAPEHRIPERFRPCYLADRDAYYLGEDHYHAEGTEGDADITPFLVEQVTDADLAPFAADGPFYGFDSIGYCWFEEEDDA